MNIDPAQIDPRLVAQRQRAMILAIGLSVVATVTSVVVRVGMASPNNNAPLSGSAALIELLALLFQLGASVVAIVLLVRVMTAMRRPVISCVLAAIAQLLPLIGLLVLLSVNQRATDICRAAGMRVGLLGAKLKG